MSENRDMALTPHVGSTLAASSRRSWTTTRDWTLEHTGIEPTGCFAAPSATPRLERNEVQVWLGNLHQGPERIEAFLRTLSHDEQERASRFRFGRDRVRFIAARGILRRLLGVYLGTASERVSFQYNEYGKPSLSGEFSSACIRFNVSHSAARVLLAFSIGREVGVDIEEVRPDLATEGIAEKYFSPFEVNALRSLPKNLRTEAFFNCWTRKEAYIKAEGNGLSRPLDEFDVSLAPGEPACLLETRVRERPASAWTLLSLDAGRGYKAALVCEGRDWRPTCWRWPDNGWI